MEARLRRIARLISLSLTFIAFFLADRSAFAGTYYIAANGSDSNGGTSEASPWMHAPGMPNCSNNCASYTPVAGDSLIFRGGDTWHFGDSSASPYTGGTWNWGAEGWDGTSSNPIYIGVDQKWFSGSSWSRPILNGDNPTSTSSVASCPYQIGSNNTLVNLANISWVTLDNFEMTGLCQNDTGAPFAHDIYLVESAASNNIYEHLYIHGWTALSFAGCSGTSGHCFNMFAFLGSNEDGDEHLQDVVDGSDSNPGSLGVMFGGGYNVSQSVFRYAAQIVITHMHLWHDNLMEHWYEPGDGQAHGNLLESSGESSHNNVIYNNVFQHICADSNSCASGIVGIWPQPSTGQTDYIFDNVCSDCQGIAGNYLNIGQNGGSQGNLVIFNNTFDLPSPAQNAILQCNSTSTHPFTAANNHYILEGGSPYSAPCTGGTFVTEWATNHATASSEGYTVSETYAYSPTSSSGATGGTGTNEMNYCNTIGTSATSDSTLSDAANSCQSDTRYGCTYNSSNHTVICPARNTITRPPTEGWSIGAYQNGSGSVPLPPTNLTGVVH
jgi:hypothetical protein